MEANEEPPSGFGSFPTEDSFLLSDYLHRQAERASIRFFKRQNPLLFLRSSIFSPQFGQTKQQIVLDRCHPGVSQSTPTGTSLAPKESSESTMNRKCSSDVFPQLEKDKNEFSLLVSTLASSTSCIESSQICQSDFAVEAAARLDESLHSDILCCESKQAVSLSSDGEQDDGVAVDESHTLPMHEADAFNLLIIAALQKKNEDEPVDPLTNGSGSSEAKGSASSALESTVSPLLKKRITRRAKSAFHKQSSDDFRLNRPKFFESVIRPFERKGNYAADHHIKDRRNASEKCKGRMVHAKRRKLQDLPVSPSDLFVKGCTDADETFERSYGVEKHQLTEHQVAGNHKFLEVGMKLRFKGFDSQASVTELPSTFSTEDSEDDCGQNKHQVTVRNHEKLQILSNRLSDACNVGHTKGGHVENRPPRINEESDLERPSFHKDDLSFGIFNYVSTGIENTKQLAERRKEPEFGVASLGDMKHGSTTLRLKILPIRLPADLPLLEDVPTMTGSETVTENGMVKRTSSRSQMGAKIHPSSINVSSRIQHGAIQTAINTDSVARTKRGRSKVLPTKFSDSILQPWNSSRRKTRVPNA